MKWRVTLKFLRQTYSEPDTKAWVRYLISNIKSDQSGLFMTYYDKIIYIINVFIKNKQVLNLKTTQSTCWRWTSYNKLWSIGNTSVPWPSQKSGHLLIHPINMGKVPYETSLPELSRHIWHLCQNFREVHQKLGKPQKIAKNWSICFVQIYTVQVQNDVTIFFSFLRRY